MVFYPRLTDQQLIDLYLMQQIKDKKMTEYVVDQDSRVKITSIMEDVKKKILQSSKDNEG